MLHRAFDFSGKDLAHRIAPVRKIGAQWIVRQDGDLGSRIQFFRRRMPGRDNTEEKDYVRFLQELRRFEAGVKMMGAGKIDIARSAALDDAGAEQFGQLDELLNNAWAPSRFLGDDQRVVR